MSSILIFRILRYLIYALLLFFVYKLAKTRIEKNNIEINMNEEDKKMRIERIKQIYRGIGIVWIVGFVLQTIFGIGFVFVRETEFSLVLYVGIARILFVLILVSLIVVLHRRNKSEKLSA